MFSSFKDFILNHKALFYSYVIWAILHITLFLSGGLITGHRDTGFFPFNGFDVDDYGIVELFVYVLALPIIAYIIYDILRYSNNTERIKKVVLIILGVIGGIGILFLIFFLVSFFYDGDYGRTGAVIGVNIGVMLVVCISVSIFRQLLIVLSKYERASSGFWNHFTKIIILFVANPIISTICASLISSSLTALEWVRHDNHDSDRLTYFVISTVFISVIMVIIGFITIVKGWKKRRES